MSIIPQKNKQKKKQKRRVQPYAKSRDQDPIKNSKVKDLI